MGLMNKETPISNQTVGRAHLLRQQQIHHERLREISSSSSSCDAWRVPVGGKWKQGPLQSKPTYTHLTQNLKGAQQQSERFEEIERENRLLLDKMSALMDGGNILDPTEGTWEFGSGVRLNRFQYPVIDHGISHQPFYPQFGAAREPESLNWGSRRRELERITNENRGIVHRIHERPSNYPVGEWTKRSRDHDDHLLLIRRPYMSPTLPVPAPFTPSSNQSSPRRRRPRSSRSAQAPVSALITPVEAGESKLQVGLCAGFVKGATILVQPGEPEEERLWIEDAWMRRDGLSILLQSPCVHPHPRGVYVHVYPEAEQHMNRARQHLEASERLMDEEVTVSVP